MQMAPPPAANPQPSGLEQALVQALFQHVPVNSGPPPAAAQAPQVPMVPPQFPTFPLSSLPSASFPSPLPSPPQPQVVYVQAPPAPPVPTTDRDQAQKEKSRGRRSRSRHHQRRRSSDSRRRDRSRRRRSDDDQRRRDQHDPPRLCLPTLRPRLPLQCLPRRPFSHRLSASLHLPSSRPPALRHGPRGSSQTNSGRGLAGMMISGAPMTSSGTRMINSGGRRHRGRTNHVDGGEIRASRDSRDSNTIRPKVLSLHLLQYLHPRHRRLPYSRHDPPLHRNPKLTRTAILWDCQSSRHHRKRRPEPVPHTLTIWPRASVTGTQRMNCSSSRRPCGPEPWFPLLKSPEISNSCPDPSTPMKSAQLCKSSCRLTPDFQPSRHMMWPISCSAAASSTAPTLTKQNALGLKASGGFSSYPSRERRCLHTAAARTPPGKRGTTCGHMAPAQTHASVS